MVVWNDAADRKLMLAVWRHYSPPGSLDYDLIAATMGDCTHRAALERVRLLKRMALAMTTNGQAATDHQQQQQQQQPSPKKRGRPPAAASKNGSPTKKTKAAEKASTANEDHDWF